MREPRSVLSRQNTPSGYFGDGQPEERQEWIVVRLIRAFVEGFSPLAILVALLALFWEASVIGRIFSTPYGIDMIQRVADVVVGGGLVISVVVYLIAATRTLRNVRDHQRNGEQIEALITLTVLAVTALATLYPLYRVLMTIQHPAP